MNKEFAKIQTLLVINGWTHNKGSFIINDALDRPKNFINLAVKTNEAKRKQPCVIALTAFLTEKEVDEGVDAIVWHQLADPLICLFHTNNGIIAKHLKCEKEILEEFTQITGILVNSIKTG